MLLETFSNTDICCKHTAHTDTCIFLQQSVLYAINRSVLQYFNHPTVSSLTNYMEHSCSVVLVKLFHAQLDKKVCTLYVVGSS